MVAHAFSSSTWECCEILGRSMSSRLAWSTQRVPRLAMKRPCHKKTKTN